MRNGRYLAGDEVPEGEKLYKKGGNIFEFYPTESPPSAISIMSYKRPALKVLKSLKYTEELFVGFPNNYQLS